MVKKSMQNVQELHRILKKHGAKYDKRGNIIKSSWGYGAIKEAQEKLKLSRSGVYKWIDDFPKIPQRQRRKMPLKPKYVDDFYESESIKEFIRIKKRTVVPSTLQNYLTTGLQCWKILNRKDPSTWNEKDYEMLWTHPQFLQTKGKNKGKITENKAVHIRQYMAIFYPEIYRKPEYGTRAIATEHGKKITHWIRTEEDLIKVIQKIKTPDTLLLYDLGIQCGGRFSSFTGVAPDYEGGIRPEDIVYATGTILMYESKTKDREERVFIKETMQLLRQYVKDMKFKSGQRIFPRDLDKINRDLKQAGRKAGILFSLTSHTAFKHTFVSFASNHGVSLEVVSKQTGTDPSTLMQFYGEVGKGKIRHELLGEPLTAPDYHTIMRRLQPHVKKRYKQIKDRMIIRKVKGKEVFEKKKKQKVRWSAVKNMLDSEKTPEQFKKYWRPRYKLHLEGVSNKEIKRRLG